MRFLLIDRFDAATGPDRARGTKAVAVSEDVFEHHFPEQAVMPGNLLLEAAAQLAWWHEVGASDAASGFLLDRVTTARWMRITVPGEVVEIELERRTAPEGRIAWTASCRVGDEERARIEFEGRRESLDERFDRAALLARRRAMTASPGGTS